MFQWLQVSGDEAKSASSTHVRADGNKTEAEVTPKAFKQCPIAHGWCALIHGIYYNNILFRQTVSEQNNVEGKEVLHRVSIMLDSRYFDVIKKILVQLI